MADSVADGGRFATSAAGPPVGIPGRRNERYGGARHAASAVPLLPCLPRLGLDSLDRPRRDQPRRWLERPVRRRRRQRAGRAWRPGLPSGLRRTVALPLRADRRRAAPPHGRDALSHLRPLGRRAAVDRRAVRPGRPDPQHRDLLHRGAVAGALGSGKWVRRTSVLEHARCGNGQNSGADLRLSGQAAVARLEISDQPPAATIPSSPSGR